MSAFSENVTVTIRKVKDQLVFIISSCGVFRVPDDFSRIYVKQDWRWSNDKQCHVVKLCVDDTNIIIREYKYGSVICDTVKKEVDEYNVALCDAYLNYLNSQNQFNSPEEDCIDSPDLCSNTQQSQKPTIGHN